jgi:hypothetical protein
VTKLPQCLRDELVVATTPRPRSAATCRSLTPFASTGARLDRLTPAQLRRYHLYLLEERRLAVGTVVTQICARRRPRARRRLTLADPDASSIAGHRASGPSRLVIESASASTTSTEARDLISQYAAASNLSTAFRPVWQRQRLDENW